MKRIILIATMTAVISAALALTACSSKSVAESPDAFLGSWSCDRASIDISPLEGRGMVLDDGLAYSQDSEPAFEQGDAYRVLIHWGGSAFESSEWEYICSFDEGSGKLVDEGKGVHATLTFDEDGSLLDEEIAYSDGSASFSLNEKGELTWKDDKDNAGKGMKFSHME